MKILIDADGCPVVEETAALARRYGVPCWILCDTAHQMNRSDAKVLVFDRGADSVDYALVSRVEPGDVVITQDYGLAAMCLARQARILHQDGWAYTADNIEALLFSRHESRRLRASGARMKGPKKRRQSQNRAFSDALEQLLQTTVQG